MQIMEATRDSNTPEFEYPYFFDQEIENSSEIQGLCLQIFSRDLALEQLKRQGFLVVDTTESFRDRLRAVGYTGDVAVDIYNFASKMHSQPDHKRRWIRADMLHSITKRQSQRVFKDVCALWSEAFQELAQVLGRSLTLRNVLGLLSEGGSNAYQTSHFDCSPGTSQDPTYVGHVTALGYMEGFSLDIWPGSHRVAHEYSRSESHQEMHLPIDVETVSVNQFQILALSSSALHRGVPNLDSVVKTRISALLIREGDVEPQGEIHYSVGNNTHTDEKFMRRTFLGCFDK